MGVLTETPVVPHSPLFSMVPHGEMIWPSCESSHLPDCPAPPWLSLSGWPGLATGCLATHPHLPEAHTLPKLMSGRGTGGGGWELFFQGKEKAPLNLKIYVLWEGYFDKNKG